MTFVFKYSLYKFIIESFQKFLCMRIYHKYHIEDDWTSIRMNSKHGWKLPWKTNLRLLTLNKNERWKLIAEMVIDKTKIQCINRVKYIRSKMKE